MAALITGRIRAEGAREVWEGTYRLRVEIELLVSLIPIGLFPSATECVPIDVETVRAALRVRDLISGLPRTPLIDVARARGCPVFVRLGMVVNPGAIGSSIWADHERDDEFVRPASRRCRLKLAQVSRSREPRSQALIGPSGDAR